MEKNLSRVFEMRASASKTSKCCSTRCYCFQQCRSNCLDLHRDEDARLLIAKVNLGRPASIIADVVNAVWVDEGFPAVDVLKPNQLHVNLLSLYVPRFLHSALLVGLQPAADRTAAVELLLTLSFQEAST